MSCRVLHRGVEEALLAQVALESEMADLEQVLIPCLPSPRNELMRNFLNRVALWAEVPSFADGPSVTIGRHGARRGVTAPVMQVSTEKLKQLKGQHSPEVEDVEAETIEIASTGQSREYLGVDWSQLLSHLATMEAWELPTFSSETNGGPCGNAADAAGKMALKTTFFADFQLNLPKRKRYELAASGVPYVVTTSRSGRIAAGQPELVQLQENLRQMCTHYNAKIDGCDIAALTDLFQWMQRPESQAEDGHDGDVDLFGTCIGTVGKAPALLSPEDLEKLKSTRDHMQETCTMLEEELKNGPSAQHEWQLKEMKKKVSQMDEVLEKMK
eukprot:symbB.v1.2.023589.t1/scaffold2168.1/size87162/3